MGEDPKRRAAQAILAKHDAIQDAMADPLTRGLIDAMKGQLLLVLVNRLGGEIRVPVTEIDGTGGMRLCMRVDGTDFVFVVRKAN